MGTLVVMSTRNVRGQAWYLITIDDGDARLCMKAHEELAKLDEDLRWVTQQRAGCVLPCFPQRETRLAKLKSLLGAGDLVERQAAMQKYLEGLVEALPSPADEPLLEDFFSRENIANVFNNI